MNKCFWGKVRSWLWSGVKEMVEVFAMMLVLILLFAVLAGIFYVLTCPLPGVDPVVVGVVDALRGLFFLLMLVLCVKNIVVEVGAKLRGFREECEEL